MATRRRKKNPSPALTILAVGAAVGLGGLAIWHFTQEESKPKAKSKKKTPDALPPPPPPPPSPTKPEEPEYGIHFSEDCSDFVMIAPPEDADPQQQRQSKILLDSLTKAIDTKTAVDPWTLAAEILEKISPDRCEFPPSPEAPERIIQLYLWMVSVVGAVVMAQGGEIVGVDKIEDLDDVIAAEGAELGYPAFDPQMVPDLFPEGADLEPESEPFPIPKPPDKPAIQPASINGEKSCPVGHIYDETHDVCCPDGYAFDPVSRTCKPIVQPKPPTLGATPTPKIAVPAAVEKSVVVGSVVPAKIQAGGKRKVVYVKGHFLQGTTMDLIDPLPPVKVVEDLEVNFHDANTMILTFDVASPGQYVVFFKGPGQTEWQDSGVAVLVE